MGWDESAFGWLFNKVKAYQAAKDSRPRLLESEEVLAGFERLASFVAGKAMTLTVVKDDGGISGDQVFLNETHPFYCSSEDAYRLYLFKIFFLIYRAGAKNSWAPLTESVFANITHEIKKDWPLFSELELEVLSLWKMKTSAETLFERPLFLNWLGVVSGAVAATSIWQPEMASKGPEEENLDDGVKTEITLQRATQIKKVDLKKQEDENPFVHSFEKVHTLDQYSGGLKTQDGADEMAEHENALQELQMDTMTISTESIHSLIKAGVVGGTVDDVSGDESSHSAASVRTFLYPEWDSRQRKYRKDWCRVIEQDACQAGNTFNGSLVQADKRNMNLLNDLIAGIKNERRWRNSQADGEDIDIDAAQDMMISILAQSSPNERVYRRKPQANPDWCVLILLDQSLSTESWIGDQQILDLEKKISQMMGQALQLAGVEWGLASFFSETRKAVHFHWHHRLDAECGKRTLEWGSLMKLRPEGATRLGPILRHGIDILNRKKNQKKLILFISDTKPTDFDYYEGQYGANDFAKAIQEARRANIHFHVCSIQSKDHKNSNSFFHPSEYSVVSKVDDLISSLKLWFPSIF